MTNPKISIIVPIYKAESSLLRCLNSLKAQTLTDFEVLMVDDGSPDRCGEMIDEYASKDFRFKAFHKPNGGVSSARQFGIDHANGEYTIHADPDDWVEPSMLEELYSKAKESNADMVICDFYINDKTYVRQEISSLHHNEVLKELFRSLHGSCWNKLIKRSCYNNFNIHYPAELSFCEDQYVIASFLKHEIKISYVSKAFYHYVQRFDGYSLSRHYDIDEYEKDMRMKQMFGNLLNGTDAYNLMIESKDQTIIYRAFYFGKNVFSGKQFKLLFSSYKRIVWRSNFSFLEKILVILSCVGFYVPSRSFISLLLSIKHFSAS